MADSAVVAAAVPVTSPSTEGLETAEEFDDASTMQVAYCKQLTAEEFEDQSESETVKSLEGLMDYLDGHRDRFRDLLRRKKRQDMETGGIISYVKLKVMDAIHGENSPLVRVSDDECERKLDNLKFNMHKAFDYSLESKGRRVSKRLAEKRQKRTQNPNGTPSRKTGTPSQKSQHTATAAQIMPPPPPPPPPPVMSTPKSAFKVTARKPFTPLQNRINTHVDTPPSLLKMRKHDHNDSLGSMPSLDTSLTSLHQELLSSNPWKRLRCVDEQKTREASPAAKKGLSMGAAANGPSEPLYQALLINIQDKFKNVRSPSPGDALYNNTVSPASALSPCEFTP